jgi:hypothetical protein
MYIYIYIYRCIYIDVYIYIYIYMYIYYHLVKIGYDDDVYFIELQHSSGLQKSISIRTSQNSISTK